MRLITTLLILSLVSTLFKTMGQGFSLSPSRLFFKGNPGETVNQTLTFGNSTNETVSYVARIQDFDRDSLGNKVYYPAGTKTFSNASWISFSSSSVVVPPGETRQLLVSLTIPTESQQLTNSMIFFSQVKEQSQTQSAKRSFGVNVLIELGIQVYFAPIGLNAGEFEFLAFEDQGILQGQKNSRRLALKLHNNGGMNKDAFIRFELTNKETGEEIKLDPTIIAMLPDATQWVYVDLPLNLQGKYLVVALLDAGSTYDLKVAEKEIIYRP